MEIWRFSSLKTGKWNPISAAEWEIAFCVNFYHSEVRGKFYLVKSASRCELGEPGEVLYKCVENICWRILNSRQLYILPGRKIRITSELFEVFSKIFFGNFLIWQTGSRDDGGRGNDSLNNFCIDLPFKVLACYLPPAKIFPEETQNKFLLWDWAVCLTCYDNSHCVMDPPLSIPGNASVVWQVPVRDSENQFEEEEQLTAGSPVYPQLRPVVDHFHWAGLDHGSVVFEP